MDNVMAFINSPLGRWLLRLVIVVFGAAAKAGYVPIPLLDVIGNIDTSDLVLGSAALVPSAPPDPNRLKS